MGCAASSEDYQIQVQVDLTTFNRVCQEITCIAQAAGHSRIQRDTALYLQLRAGECIGG